MFNTKGQQAESTATKLKRVIARRRVKDTEDSSIQSDASSHSDLRVRRPQKMTLQAASTALFSSRKSPSNSNAAGTLKSSGESNSNLSPPPPPPHPPAIRLANKLTNRASTLIPSPGISAALEYMMDHAGGHKNDDSASSRRLSLIPPSPTETIKRRSVSLHSTSPPADSLVRVQTHQGLLAPPGANHVPSSAPLPISSSFPPVLQSEQIGAEGIIGGSGVSLGGGNIRGRLAAWTVASAAVSNSPQPSSHPAPNTHPAPKLQPSPNLDRQLPLTPTPSRPSSLTSQSPQLPSFGPGPGSTSGQVTSSTGSSTTGQGAGGMVSAATGFALTFSKKAYERVGLLWGSPSSAAPLPPSKSNGKSVANSSATNLNASSSNLNSSSANLTVSSSSWSGRSGAPGRPHLVTAANRNASRGTPNATSGTWSVASSSTAIGKDAARDNSLAQDSPDHDTGDGMGSGPVLGQMLRGPTERFLRFGGVVFGKPLAECVRETKAVDECLNSDQGNAGGRLEDELDSAVEARYIPALILRCVQHLEKWGVEEEGVFRITGRSSHVAKLRTEFDTGADYDLLACSPSELDPHSVSSVFKAYLRELPEPILTRVLAGQFDDAIERAKSPPSELNLSNRMVNGSNGPPRKMGLPGGGPRPTKPILGQGEKLSIGVTISHPSPGSMISPTSIQQPHHPIGTSISGPPPPTLLHNLSSLIALLPRENRDLLLTILELLGKTAAHFKTTRMPLSNLLVVFCPSLGMNPGLLKVLVENRQAIWRGPKAGPKEIAARNEIAALSDLSSRTKEGMDVPPARPRPDPGNRKRVPAPLTLHVYPSSSMSSLDESLESEEAKDTADSQDTSRLDGSHSKQHHRGASDTRLGWHSNRSLDKPLPAQPPKTPANSQEIVINPEISLLPSMTEQVLDEQAYDDITPSRKAPPPPSLPPVLPSVVQTPFVVPGFNRNTILSPPPLPLPSLHITLPQSTSLLPLSSKALAAAEPPPLSESAVVTSLLPPSSSTPPLQLRPTGASTLSPPPHHPFTVLDNTLAIPLSFDELEQSFPTPNILEKHLEPHVSTDPSQSLPPPPVSPMTLTPHPYAETPATVPILSTPPTRTSSREPHQRHFAAQHSIPPAVGPRKLTIRARPSPTTPTRTGLRMFFNTATPASGFTSSAPPSPDIRTLDSPYFLTRPPQPQPPQTETPPDLALSIPPSHGRQLENGTPLTTPSTTASTMTSSDSSSSSTSVSPVSPHMSSTYRQPTPIRPFLSSTTPIADLFSQSAPILGLSDSSSNLSHGKLPPQLRSPRGRPSGHTDEVDWASSVLLAAGADHI